MSLPPIAEASDADIAAALAEANFPALTMAIAHLAGDAGMFGDRHKPDGMLLREDFAGIDEDARAEILDTALRVLGDYRDGRIQAIWRPDDAQLHSMLRFASGGDIGDEYLPMMIGELNLEGTDGYGIEWRKQPSAETLEEFQVLVIGAGMSGICAAYRLKEAGIPYTVVEKNPAVGGTWYENSYPGCKVDVPNHFYSYSFETQTDWPQYYSNRDQLHDYFEQCVDNFGIRDDIRFETEVVRASFDEADGCWHVELKTPEGGETLMVNAIVSAVGQLNRPKLPPIEGIERYEGPWFHSAYWDHSHDPVGKRVAVVGTGASSMQLCPEVAKVADRLLIFQRSPQWAAYSPDYDRDVSEQKQWLIDNVPFYANWYRFVLFWRTSDGMYAALVADPDWEHPERAMNAVNDMQREMFTAHIIDQVGGDEDLIAKALPDYPPMGKRMLIDNGWFKMLTRGNVDLIVDPVDEVVEKGIRTADGEVHEVDMIVYATGFHSHRFLWPMEIVGRSGRALNEVWGENARAYLGITVPDFPNLFCLYGPNTNLGHGGSIIFHTECQVRYTLRCLRELLEGGHRFLDCDQDVHDAYNDRVDAQHERMIWTHEGMTNWYRNAEGRVDTNSPWRLVDYWEMTLEPDPADYAWG
ncbi:MAG: NAD(P)/FAD-dependent oxidoreductase [bacterium]|nr:NAD(P)/FAD-dependent oxidoreductase [bacterium]MCY3633921.1 NAD(P)/FAD-dependent oxidoreductase [bacterium]